MIMFAEVLFIPRVLPEFLAVLLFLEDGCKRVSAWKDISAPTHQPLAT